MTATEMAIGGIALIPLIIGLVEFSKKVGIAGKMLIVEAFILGIVFVAAWAAIQEGLIPQTVQPWIRVAVAALGGGVAAMSAVGNYDLAKRFFGH